MEQRLYPTERRIQVKTYEIDYVGHVNNINYVKWLEDLRLAWLDDHFPLDEQMKNDMAPVLLETHIRYIKAIRLFDDVTGRIWVAKLGKVKFDLGFEFVVKGEVYASATQTGLLISLKRQKPVRFPLDRVK